MSCFNLSLAHLWDVSQQFTFKIRLGQHQYNKLILIVFQWDTLARFISGSVPTSTYLLPQNRLRAVYTDLFIYNGITFTDLNEASCILVLSTTTLIFHILLVNL